MPNEKKDPRSSPQQDESKAELSRVTPRLEPMPAGLTDPPESIIGDRISFARKELNLSVEALARYTSNFDPQEEKGISATSLLRYESGEFKPGAREIRILCDAFAVPPKWLLYGTLDNAGDDALEQKLLRALEDYVVQRAHEPRLEGGVPYRTALSGRPTDKDRRDWLEKAKARTREK